MHKHKVSISVFLIALCVFLFTIIAIFVNSKALKQFDTAIIESIQGMISAPLTTFFLAVTFIGSVKGVSIITIIFFCYLFYRRNYLYGLYLIISVGVGAGILNKLLKAFFQRERPDMLRIVSESGFSFPSGHAMGSVILFGGIALILYKMNGMVKLTIVCMVMAATLIIIIGLSRIYLGVHYPTDIIAGYVAGVIWVTISNFFYKSLIKMLKV